MMSGYRAAISLVMLSLLLVTARVAHCEQSPGATGADDTAAATSAPLSVTTELLDVRRKELASNQQLDDAARKRLTELYDKVASDLGSIKVTGEKTKTYSLLMLQSGDEVKKLRSEDEGRKPVAPSLELGFGDDTALETISARLLKEKADRAAAAARLDDLAQQLAQQRDRPDAIRQELVTTNQEQARVAGELKLAPAQDQDPILAEAQGWRLEAEGALLSARLLMLEQELLSQPARVGLLEAQRDQAERRVEYLDGRIRYLESISARRREAEVRQAKEQAREAKEDAVGKHPLLGQAAQHNVTLSNELQQATAELAQVSSDDDELVARAEELEEQLRIAKQKLAIAGLSQALGQVMLAEKRRLPDADELQREMENREGLTVRVTLRQLQHTHEYKDLRHLDRVVADAISGLNPADRQAVEPQLRALLEERKGIVERFQQTDGEYLRALAELAIAQTRLAQAATKMDEFLSERLLWIRSAPAIGTDIFGRLRDEWRRLRGSLDWRPLAAHLWDRATAAPTLVLGLALVLWLRLRAPTHLRRLRATAEPTRRPRTDRLGHSVKALGYSLLVAAPWPLLMAWVGWELGRGEGSLLADVLAALLLGVAPVYFLIASLRVICKPGGLAIAHLRWPEDATNALRRQLMLLTWTLLPAALLVGLVVGTDPDSLGGDWGRLGMLLVMTLVVLFELRLFAPRGALRLFSGWAPGSLLARWQTLWLLLAIALPLTLAGLTLAGYSYTAAILLLHLVDTLALIILLLLVQQMALRWLLVSRRRIALRVALEKREARKARDSDEAAAVAFDDHDLDVVALSQESRKLVNMVVFLATAVGFWLIWRDVVPALAIFSDVQLWQRTQLVDGVPQLAPVTLASLMLGVLVLALTVIAAKRLPALLELILIQVFDMSQGGRYTVTTLTGYGLVVGGSVYVLSVLGVAWSELQWLVAALGVGIGFGLQEIVANFISGLIILFERPIRVGDVVTIGNVDGTVTRIRIRATTIRNWDNKELLVPNKEFITGRLMNWTLSDSVTRLQTKVGIAYGSDVGNATELMLAAAREHEQVMDDPAPSVIFEAFGASSLDLALRCFVASSDLRTGVLSSLNRQINDRFVEAGIEIAYPQQDVHLDSKRPFEVLVRRERPGEAS